MNTKFLKWLSVLGAVVLFSGCAGVFNEKPTDHKMGQSMLVGTQRTFFGGPFGYGLDEKFLNFSGKMAALSIPLPESFLVPVAQERHVFPCVAVYNAKTKVNYVAEGLYDGYVAFADGQGKLLTEPEHRMRILIQGVSEKELESGVVNVQDLRVALGNQSCKRFYGADGELIPPDTFSGSDFEDGAKWSNLATLKPGDKKVISWEELREHFVQSWRMIDVTNVCIVYCTKEHEEVISMIFPKYMSAEAIKEVADEKNGYTFKDREIAALPVFAISSDPISTGMSIFAMQATAALLKDQSEQVPLELMGRLLKALQGQAIIIHKSKSP